MIPTGCWHSSTRSRTQRWPRSKPVVGHPRTEEGCVDCANAGNRGQQSRRRIRAGGLGELFVERGDTTVQVAPFTPLVFNQHSGPWAEHDLLGRQKRIEVQFQLASAWCMDQGCRRTNPDPALGSGDTDIAWASQIQHPVEDMDSHVNLGRPTLVFT